MAIGILLAGGGLLFTLTESTAEAASVTCDTTLASTSLFPGSSGSCVVSFAESAARPGKPFTVTVDVRTTSASGSAESSGGTAAEALLDGQPAGLQVTISDSARNRYGLGAVTCSGSYPDASACSSSDDNQPVPGASDLSSWNDTFTIAWYLPRTAGNPYQGGSATVTVTPYYSGVPATPPTPAGSPSPSGGVAGASETPTPSGAALPASIPATGAGPSGPTQVLLGIGLGLLLLGGCGLAVSSRARRRASRPPAI